MDKREQSECFHRLQINHLSVLELNPWQKFSLFIVHIVYIHRLRYRQTIMELVSLILSMMQQIKTSICYCVSVQIGTYWIPHVLMERNSLEAFAFFIHQIIRKFPFQCFHKLIKKISSLLKQLEFLYSEHVLF